MPLAIGGVGVELEYPAAFASVIPETWRSRFEAPISTDLRLSILEHPDPPGPREIVDGLDVDVAVKGTTLAASRRDFDLEVDLASGQGVVRAARQLAAVSSAVRIALSRVLPMRRRAFLLHAAGVVAGGRTWVFFGPSGAGKSTTAQQLAEWPVMSDEIVAVALEDEQVVAYGTPFSGSLSSAGDPAGQHVGGLFRLAKATRLSEREMTTSEARAALMQCVLVFGEARDLAGVLLDLVSEVCARAPVFELALPPAGALLGWLHGRTRRLPGG